jgi:alginate O-acetyltransferase complex protein AlgI
MNFATFGYVVFLLIVVGGYWVLPRRARHWWLLGASLFFYGTWNLVYVPGFLVLIGFNHWMGHLAARPDGRRWMIVAVSFDLALLGVFKYLDWVLGSTWSVVGAITGREVELGTLGLILPLAISFVTFTFVAYIVDVHRGRPPEQSLLRFATFVMYFPHLVAGPIMRAREFLPQLHHWRPFKGRLFVEGAPLLLTGMLKKSCADLLAPTVADAMADPGRFSSLGLAIAATAFTFQLYLDFSGYTDIALGSARLMGFRLPQNFDWPYRSTNMSDFWKRWHITLGRWLRDYLYFPLGGSKKGSIRAYVNLMVTMTLAGLWHGAGWTFILWGFWQGVALCAYRFWKRKGDRVPHMPVWLGWAVTFVFVVMVRIFFVADSLDQALDYLREMFTPHGGDLPATWVIVAVGLGMLAQWTWVADTFRKVALSGQNRRLLTYGTTFALVVFLLPVVAPAFIYFEF